jgi:hypothetical protein
MSMGASPGGRVEVEAKGLLADDEEDSSFSSSPLFSAVLRSVSVPVRPSLPVVLLSVEEGEKVVEVVFDAGRRIGRPVCRTGALPPPPPLCALRILLAPGVYCSNIAAAVAGVRATGAAAAAAGVPRELEARDIERRAAENRECWRSLQPQRTAVQQE